MIEITCFQHKTFISFVLQLF